jgi:hypothetical protein
MHVLAALAVAAFTAAPPPQLADTRDRIHVFNDQLAGGLWPALVRG